jgi:hypothetical protein
VVPAGTLLDVFVVVAWVCVQLELVDEEATVTVFVVVVS